MESAIAARNNIRVPLKSDRLHTTNWKGMSSSDRRSTSVESNALFGYKIFFLRFAVLVQKESRTTDVGGRLWNHVMTSVA